MKISPQFNPGFDFTGLIFKKEGNPTLTYIAHEIPTIKNLQFEKKSTLDLYTVFFGV